MDVVPLIGQLRHYSARWARADIVAGFATAVTLLPQGLAFGALAGLSPVAGLYTALGAATIFALLTATRFVAVGPSSAMALLTFAVVHGQAGGGDRAVALTAALSFLVGVGCLLVAVLPLQGVADFLSGPVMLGYLAGLGIQLFAGQVGTLLGIPTPGSEPLVKLWHVLTHLEQAKALTAMMGLGAVAALMVLGRYLTGVPAGLVVCVLAIAISAAVGLADQGVAVVGPAVGGLPAITWPQVTLEDLWALLLPAVGMTLVASVETFSAVRQAGAEADGRISLDRETAALGAASLVTGMLTGFPPMASTSRTLSARSSAHSQLFQLIAAGIVAFVLFTGGPLVALLPMPVLAAILVVGAPKLIDVTGLRWLWRGWRAEGVIALVAVAGVLGLGVLRGLLIAVILSASQLIRRAARPHDSLLAIIDEGHPPQEIADGDASPHPDILIYRVDAPLFFANARRVRQRVLALVTAREPRPRCVICDMQAVFYVDATAADALAQLTAELQALGCRLVLARVREPVLAVLRANPYHDGATQRLPVFPGVRQAFTAVREP